MNTDPTIIKLTNVRLSFPSLHEKQAPISPGGKAAYKASFLLHKTKNAATIKAIQAAIAHLTKEEFAGKALPPTNLCLKEADLKEYDGYDSEHMVLSASNSKTKPGIVDNELNTIAQGDAADPYPGCYVNATIRLWVQDNKFGKRVNAELRAVQFLKDGESFGAGPVVAENEFDAIPDGDEPSPRSSGRSRSSGGKPSVDDF